MKTPVFSILLALGVSLPASAAIVLQEQFDYALSQDALIGGSTGGTGFSAVWGAGASQYQTSGLTYSSATVALATAPVGGAVDVLATSNVSRTFNIAAIPASGTYWGAFLFSAPTNPVSGNRMMVWGTGSGSGMGVEFTPGAVGSGTGTIAARGGTGGLSGVTSSTTTFDLSTTHLVLFRSVWSADAGGDSMTIWLNPNDVSSVSSLGTGLTVSGDFLMTTTSGLYLRANSTTNEWRFDEFSLGQNLSDVVSVVPEPSLAILAGLPFGGLLLRRRR